MTAVHLYVDEGVYVVAVAGTKETPIAEAPKNLSELRAYSTRYAGWTLVPEPPHLHLVE